MTGYVGRLSTAVLAAFVFVVISGPGASISLAAEAEPFATGRLWQVQKPGGPASYVFGTIHVPDPRVERLPARVDELLASIDRLILEIDPKDMRSAAARHTLPGDDTLSKFSDADTLEQVLEYAEYVHLPAYTVLRMRPTALSSVLSLPYPVAKRVYAGLRGVDQQLADAALNRDIPVYGLETVEEQMAVLNALEKGREAEMLRTLAYQRRSLLRAYDQIVEAYVAGDVLAYFEATMERYRQEDPMFALVYTNTAILGRNRTMVERAEKHLKAGKTLIAVGALHIPGRGGILDLLSIRGYTVTRLE